MTPRLLTIQRFVILRYATAYLPLSFTFYRFLLRLLPFVPKAPDRLDIFRVGGFILNLHPKTPNIDIHNFNVPIIICFIAATIISPCLFHLSIFLFINRYSKTSLQYFNYTKIKTLCQVKNMQHNFIRCYYLIQKIVLIPL